MLSCKNKKQFMDFVFLSKQKSEAPQLNLNKLVRVFELFKFRKRVEARCS